LGIAKIFAPAARFYPYKYDFFRACGALLPLQIGFYKVKYPFFRACGALYLAKYYFMRPKDVIF